MSRPWIKLTPVLTMILGCGLMTATISPRQAVAHHSMWHLDNDFDSTNNDDDGEGWQPSEDEKIFILSLVGAISVGLFSVGLYQSVREARDGSAALTPDQRVDMWSVAVGNIIFGSFELVAASTLWAIEEEPLYAIPLAFSILQLGVGAWGVYEVSHPSALTSIDKVTLAPMFLPEPSGVTVGATMTIVSF
jgi:hypothetical protein